MQKKLFLGCAMLAIVANSYGLEIYKGRVLNHKEWTTGNVKAIYKPLSAARVNEIRNRAFTKKSESGSTFIDTFSSAIPAKGTVGTPLNFNGEHFIFIENETASMQSYSYTLSVCAQTSGHTSHCSYYYDEVELEPGGYVTVNESPELQLSFSQVGVYHSYVSSHLFSHESNVGRINSSSSAESTIEIS